MQVGEQVEVHTKFNNSWAPGFEIAEVASTGYRVRRRSDGVLLPDVTGEADVRPAGLRFLTAHHPRSAPLTCSTD